MEVAVETFWQIPHWAHSYLYLLAGVAIVILMTGIVRHYLKWKKCFGYSSWEWTHIPQKMFLYILGHRKIISRKPEGIIHVLVFWGFIGLLMATTIVAAHEYISNKILINARFQIFSFLADFAGILFLLGTSWALYRRLVKSSSDKSRGPNDRHNESQRSDILILMLLLMVALSGFLTKGLHIAGSSSSYHVIQYNWSMMSQAVAHMISLLNMEPNSLAEAHFYVWFGHITISFCVIALLPYTKLFHALTAPANILISPLQNKALPVLQPLQNMENQLDLGAVKPEALSGKEALEVNACTNCGRCEDQCPANLTGKRLSPRKIVQGIKNAFADGKSWLIGEDGVRDGIIGADMVWNCTTCGACAEQCPVSISPLNKIYSMRFALTGKGEIPAVTAKGLESLQALDNPWEYSRPNRYEWLNKFRIPEPAGQELEVVYWTGCGVSYDAQIQTIATTVIDILGKANVKFKVLAKEEICCGDPARRMGDEALFQSFARRNQEMLRQYKDVLILTHCPHCYHVLKNEYAKLGYEHRVVHHSQYILQLVQDGRLSLKEQRGQKVIYHDPCYLGRHNKEFDHPRNLITAIPNMELLEFEDNRNTAMCCGGGGGQFWVESEVGERIDSRRFNSAVLQQPDVVATACPYCKVMMDTACSGTSYAGKIKVKDISELIEIG